MIKYWLTYMTKTWNVRYFSLGVFFKREKNLMFNFTKGVK